MRKKITSFIFIIMFIAASVPSAFAAPTSLPDANTAPLPQWGQLTFPPAGGSYQDVGSGVKVWRLTDPSAPLAGETWKNESSQAVDISRTTDGDGYYVLFEDANTGTPWMAHLSKSSGVSDYRNMSSLFANADQAQFSRVWAYGLYYISSNGEIIRYDVNKKLPGNWDMWPKNLKTDARILGTFGNVFTARDIQMDNKDEWFSMRIVNGGTNLGTAMWDAVDNRMCTYRGNVTRDFEFENGSYVLMEIGGSSYVLLNLSNCSTAAANINFVPDAIDAGLSYAVLRNPTTHDIFRFDPTTNSMTRIADMSAASDGYFSFSGGWSTQTPGTGEWMVGSSWGLDADHVVVGGFSQLVSGIYVTQQVGFNWAENTITAAIEGIIGSGDWLTSVGSVNQLMPGTFYWDAASKILYVFRMNAGDPNNIVQGYDPRAGFQGIIFFKSDWSDERFLAFHNSSKNNVGLEPRASVSPDGSLVMWASDMYGSGRTDVFVAETPNSPQLANPFPLPAVDVKANGSDGPITIQCGDPLNISWNTGNNPNQCTASGNWSGTKICAPSSQTINQVTPPGTNYYTLSAANEYGSGSDTVEVDVQANPPTVNLQVNGSSNNITVPYGSSVNLSWSAAGTNPLQCIASGDWSGVKSCGSGSQTIGPLNQARTYVFTLGASDACGNSNDTVSVTVLAPPSVDIKANGTDSGLSIANNGYITLSWTTTGSPTLCTASGNWSGNKSCLGGSQVVGPFIGPQTLTFTLSASNGYVATNDSVTVNVAAGKQGDITGDGCVNVVDLGILLSNWMKTGSNAADINKDGIVNVVDLGILLSNWGC